MRCRIDQRLAPAGLEGGVAVLGEEREQVRGGALLGLDGGGQQPAAQGVQLLLLVVLGLSLGGAGRSPRRRVASTRSARSIFQRDRAACSARPSSRGLRGPTESTMPSTCCRKVSGSSPGKTGMRAVMPCLTAFMREAILPLRGDRASTHASILATDLGATGRRVVRAVIGGGPLGDRGASSPWEGPAPVRVAPGPDVNDYGRALGEEVGIP